MPLEGNMADRKYVQCSSHCWEIGWAALASGVPLARNSVRVYRKGVIRGSEKKGGVLPTLFVLDGVQSGPFHIHCDCSAKRQRPFQRMYMEEYIHTRKSTFIPGGTVWVPGEAIV